MAVVAEVGDTVVGIDDDEGCMGADRDEDGDDPDNVMSVSMAVM